MFLKILIVAIFVAVTVAVGVFARKHSNSVDGFVLGGRNVGPWLSAFAFGTSYFSAVVFIGYAGQFGWKYGMSVFWVGIGNAVIGSLLAWWVLGPRTREMTQRLKATTMPEFFGKRYNSRALRIAAAAIIFVFLIPYTASVYNGLSRLFGMAFGLPYEWCVIGMAVVTCIYVVLGGYVASVWNDFIQGTIMLIGIIAVIFAVLNGQGGIATAIVNLSQIPAEGSAMAGPFTSMFGPDALNLLGVIILTSLGTWALPQMVQKFYASRPVRPSSRAPSSRRSSRSWLRVARISWVVSAACSVAISPMLLMARLSTTRSCRPCSPDFPTFCLASWWCSCSPRPCRRLRVLCSPLLQRSHST